MTVCQTPLSSNLNHFLRTCVPPAYQGPSGSGKSTLLSILSSSRAGLPEGSSIGGTVTLGGVSRASTLRRATAFVPQTDVLLPALTVSECVQYSALLRLPASMGHQVRWAKRACSGAR